MAIFVLMAAAVGIGWAILHFQARRAARQRAELRKRFVVPADGPRIPLAGEREPAAPGALIGEIDPPAVEARGGLRPQVEASLRQIILEESEPEEPAPVVGGRFVQTADGEALITTPPFALRETLLSRREAQYAAAISRRLPRGLVLCPKVRLDSLVTPTAPDGRDPEDWRTWRRRVRVRAVDLVICEATTWRPLAAIEVDRPEGAARQIGGGIDRLVDEVLAEVGLPLIRCVGRPAEDWPMIEPYVRGLAAAG